VNDLEQILVEDDFVTSDKFLHFAGPAYIYRKRDFLFRPGKWRSEFIFPLWANPFLNIKKILVVGHSDRSLEMLHLRALRLLGIKKIYGINTLNFRNYAESIPLGLTNDCDDSPIHRIFGNTEHLRQASNLTEVANSFNPKLYINFTTSNNLSGRQELLNVLKKYESVEFDEPDFSNQGRIKYLANLRKFSLVPCPEGNGVDTHRLWETLYMGGTPVVIESPYLPKILDLLPVIKLQYWEELHNTNAIEKFWWDAVKKRNQYEYLRFTYWKSRLNLGYKG